MFQNSRTTVLMAAAFVALAGAARAIDPPRFAFPAACRLGETCWAVNYTDVDAVAGRASDFRCGTRTYDGHDGTDFAVRDAKAMEAGVSVLAAADGTVLRIRDAMVDREPAPHDIKSLLASNTGCGNGVVIDHGGGWQSIYCHMKLGSITVAPRQSVRRGQAIGKIGQSGAAEFPHVHFGVLHNGKKVDPFTGAEVGTMTCGAGNAAPLWDAASGIGYQSLSLYAAGFVAGAADYEQVKKDAGSPERLRREDLDALSFWMIYFGAVRDDRIRIEVTDPDGKPFVQQEFAQGENRARQFYFAGKKATGEALKRGTYTGKATVVHKGAEVRKDEIVKTVTLE